MDAAEWRHFMTPKDVQNAQCRTEQLCEHRHKDDGAV